MDKKQFELRTRKSNSLGNFKSSSDDKFHSENELNRKKSNNKNLNYENLNYLKFNLDKQKTNQNELKLSKRHFSRSTIERTELIDRSIYTDFDRYCKIFGIKSSFQALKNKSNSKLSDYSSNSLKSNQKINLIDSNQMIYSFQSKRYRRKSNLKKSFKNCLNIFICCRSISTESNEFTDKLIQKEFELNETLKQVLKRNQELEEELNKLNNFLYFFSTGNFDKELEQRLD